MTNDNMAKVVLLIAAFCLVIVSGAVAAKIREVAGYTTFFTPTDIVFHAAFFAGWLVRSSLCHAMAAKCGERGE